MNIIEILILALGLAMDAFAVSICLGLDMKQATFKKALIVGLYFGVFQALMPVFGYLLATIFADKIVAYDHWISFGLLSILGLKMIIGCFKKDKGGCHDRVCSSNKCLDRVCPLNIEPSLKPLKMIPFALATSIDAMAVGVTLALVQVKIVSAISIIGLVTLSLSIIGVKIGNLFGIKLKSKAEFLGGLILILIGLKILLEHLGIINF